jgi:serine O-acetyltransferase
MFHNVTLGGTSKEIGRRHPTLENNVYVGTGAILLGPIRVGAHSKIGANSFVRMHDVPPNCTVVGAPARIVKSEGVRVDKELPVTQLPEGSIPVDQLDRGE